MGSELEKRVEELLETRPGGTKKLEFQLAGGNLLGIIERLVKIDNPTGEQQKAALLVLASGLRSRQLRDSRNRALIEECHLIKAIHGSRIYKTLGMTWGEYCKEAWGASRQAVEPYEHIAENMPQYMVEELVTQGAALKDLRLISSEIGKAEGAEIEFLDGPESKAVVVRGSKYSLEAGSEEAIRAMMRFANDQARELENERRVRAMALEQAEAADGKLTAEKEKNKQLRERIDNGVRQLADMKSTQFEDRLLELQKAAAQLRTAEMSTLDEQKIKRYWEVLSASVIDPLKEFFLARTNEIEDMEFEPDMSDGGENN